MIRFLLLWLAFATPLFAETLTRDQLGIVAQLQLEV